MESNKVIPIWQPVGHSTHIIAKRISEYLDLPTSHTGTVDPMAEGVVIILSGEERNKKYEYAKWKKEYEFEIAFGINTDTYDGLGITNNLEIPKINSDKLFKEVEKISSEFIGKYVQKYPPYSAKSVGGKPLHWYARNEKLDEIDIPEKEGEIFNLEILGKKEMILEDLIDKIIFKINKVTGNLRQEEIKSNWQKILENNNFDQKISVVRFKVEMSKGLYVRALSQDIVKKLGEEGFVFALARTRNGVYTKQNSKKLEEIFGSKFRDDYDFVSRSMA